MMSNPIEDPIQRLRTGHDRVLEIVDAMEEAIAHLAGPGREAAYRSLGESQQFLARDARVHVALEEDVLYPQLARHVAASTLEIMTDEHRDIAWAVERLAEALTLGERGSSEVRWHVTTLADLLRRHIDKENEALFLMVTQRLSDHEYEDLARAMNEVVAARQQMA